MPHTRFSDEPQEQEEKDANMTPLYNFLPTRSSLVVEQEQQRTSMMMTKAIESHSEINYEMQSIVRRTIIVLDARNTEEEASISINDSSKKIAEILYDLYKTINKNDDDHFIDEKRRMKKEAEVLEIVKAIITELFVKEGKDALWKLCLKSEAFKTRLRRLAGEVGASQEFPEKHPDITPQSPLEKEKVKRLNPGQMEIIYNEIFRKASDKTRYIRNLIKGFFADDRKERQQAKRRDNIVPKRFTDEDLSQATPRDTTTKRKRRGPLKRQTIQVLLNCLNFL